MTTRVSGFSFGVVTPSVTHLYEAFAPSNLVCECPRTSQGFPVTPDPLLEKQASECPPALYWLVFRRATLSRNLHCGMPSLQSVDRLQKPSRIDQHVACEQMATRRHPPP